MSDDGDYDVDGGDFDGDDIDNDIDEAGDDVEQGDNVDILPGGTQKVKMIAIKKNKRTCRCVFKSLWYISPAEGGATGEKSDKKITSPYMTKWV